MSMGIQWSGSVKLNQMNKMELAKLLAELICEDENVRMAIINLASASPYINTRQ